MCEASQLLICLLLEDAGLDPVIVVPAVKFSWPQLRPWVETASANQAKQNPMLLHARIRIVTGPWEDKNPASAMPQIGISPLWGPIGLERGAGSIPDFLLSQPTRGWHAFRNLTAEMLKLEQALHSS
jgi:hypothetical protein